MPKFAVRRWTRTLCGYEWQYTGETVEAPTKDEAKREYVNTGHFQLVEIG